MKLVARAVAALAILSFATPALPCADHAKTVKAEKKSTTVAKSGTKDAKEKKSTAPAKTAGESKPATATN